VELITRVVVTSMGGFTLMKSGLTASIGRLLEIVVVSSALTLSIGVEVARSVSAKLLSATPGRPG
jgi:hypothetical protein